MLFLGTDTELNDVLAGYFYKLVKSLLNNSPKSFLKFTLLSDFLERLLYHSFNNSIASIVILLIDISNLLEDDPEYNEIVDRVSERINNFLLVNMNNSNTTKVLLELLSKRDGDYSLLFTSLLKKEILSKLLAHENYTIFIFISSIINDLNNKKEKYYNLILSEDFIIFLIKKLLNISSDEVQYTIYSLYSISLLINEIIIYIAEHKYSSDVLIDSINKITMNYLIISINNEKCNILHNVIFNCLSNDYLLSKSNIENLIRIIISSISNIFILPFLVKLSIKINSVDTKKDEEWMSFYNKHIIPLEKIYSKKLLFDQKVEEWGFDTKQQSKTLKDDEFDENNQIKSSFQDEASILKKTKEDKKVVKSSTEEIITDKQYNLDFDESDFEF